MIPANTYPSRHGTTHEVTGWVGIGVGDKDEAAVRQTRRLPISFALETFGDLCSLLIARDSIYNGVEVADKPLRCAR